MRRGVSAVAALACAGALLSGCSGSSETTPGTPLPDYATASCSTSGATSATISPATIVGVTQLSSPVVGGCAVTVNFSTVITGATAGTYGGAISLAAPAGLQALPASDAPPGFASATFVPLFYLTFQLSGFVGTLSQDESGLAIALNSFSNGANRQNFFTGTWSGSVVTGSTPPAIGSLSFTGWSNNNNQAAPAALPLTVFPTVPGLSFGIQRCTLTPPATSPPAYCPASVVSTPSSLTNVTVVGYFTN